MRSWSLVACVVASLALVACGGPKKDAKAPETNPWADYKGTYAAGGSEPEATPPRSAEKTSTVASADTKSDTKPSKTAKPSKKTAASETKTTSAVEPKGDDSDTRAMYGVPPTSKSDDDAATTDPPAKPKKGAKRAAGKKPGAKKPGPKRGPPSVTTP